MKKWHNRPDLDQYYKNNKFKVTMTPFQYFRYVVSRKRSHKRTNK